MIVQGTITAEQLLSFIIVNLAGVALVGLIFRLIPNNPNKKIVLSVGVGLIAVGILIIAFLDVGIYLWVTSGNFRSVYSVLPLSLCFVPILFPVTVIGTYIQLSYVEKIKGYIYSAARKQGSAEKK